MSRAARPGRVIGGQLLEPRGHHRLLIVRADVETFDPPLTAGSEFFE
jgi:hypothetical protein